MNSFVFKLCCLFMLLTVVGKICPAFADETICAAALTPYHAAFALKNHGYPKNEFVYLKLQNPPPQEVVDLENKMLTLGMKGLSRHIWLKSPGENFARIHQSYSGFSVEALPEAWPASVRERFQTLRNSGIEFFVPINRKWDWGTSAEVVVYSAFVKDKATSMIFLRPDGFDVPNLDHEMQHALDAVVDIDSFLASLPPAPNGPVEALERSVKFKEKIPLLKNLRLKAIMELPKVAMEMRAYGENLRYACSVDGRGDFLAAPISTSLGVFRDLFYAGWYSLHTAAVQTAVNPFCWQTATTYAKAITAGATWVVFQDMLGSALQHISILILN